MLLNVLRNILEQKRRLLQVYACLGPVELCWRCSQEVEALEKFICQLEVIYETSLQQY